MKDMINKGITNLKSTSSKLSNGLLAGYSVVVDKINGLPIFVSSERAGKEQSTSFDEKHYFVIPYYLSEHQFALHTMRCLPKGVPEVNNLPKRRVFHFANEHAEQQLRNYMTHSVNDIVRADQAGNPNTLETLANNIDSLDKKLTYGMLLAGGLAAFVNPVIGAGLLAKAVLPSMTGMLNKYGVRPSAEKLSKYQINKAIKEAQSHVIKQFEEANTVQLINPILQELELALRTTESEHDPLTGFNLAEATITELDGEKWRELTELAICHVYKKAYETPSLHKQANLGPEDIRWLDVMFEVNKASLCAEKRI